MKENKKEEALRFNEGKIRYDLLDDYALEQMAKVLTKGAEKYDEENWRKGMKWSKCEASLKRHLAAYKENQDVDPETGLWHLSHAMVNLMFMVNYYKTHPELDDRRKSYLTQPKITLDVDQVVANWQEAYSERFGVPVDPKYWDQSYTIGGNLALLKEEKDFWVNLKVLHFPDFMPEAYISSRSIPVAWTEEFLEKNGLPCAPVYHVPFGESKIEILKQIGSEIHIDDSFRNFKECEQNGITGFLMNASHNLVHDVGYRRIHNLQIRNIIR